MLCFPWQGVKLTGNRHVPAGETTFRIDLADQSVQMQHANIGFKNARWVSDYRVERQRPNSFSIKHAIRSAWDCQFFHLSVFKYELLK